MDKALMLAWPDLAVIAVYLTGIVGLGLWAWTGLFDYRLVAAILIAIMIGLYIAFA
jgi:hypothetical protein